MRGLPTTRVVAPLLAECRDVGVVPALGEEARGEPDPEEAARALAAGRVGAVLRQGAMGCLLASGGTLCAVAPHRVTPVDTNGAGDCHIGSFIAELARSGDAARAARYANVAAALSITQAGPATAPAREQVLPLL